MEDQFLKILALSSSRSGSSAYLEAAVPLIRELLGTTPLKLAFIPFASVGSHDEYFRRVTEAFRPLIHSIDLVTLENGRNIVNDSDGVLVGGGNTFKLLHDLYQSEIIGVLREKVRAGLPYIGWSAGSNILGPTICTTNDMPIIQPASFDALNIFPFQINPHYYNQRIEGFNGETRDQRLEEFLTINQQSEIIALPEGTALMVNGRHIIFVGSGGVRFRMEDGQVKKSGLESGCVVAGNSLR